MSRTFLRIREGGERAERSTGRFSSLDQGLPVIAQPCLPLGKLAFYKRLGETIILSSRPRPQMEILKGSKVQVVPVFNTIGNSCRHIPKISH